MELLKTQTIAVLTPSDTDSLEFMLPLGITRWSLHILPLHSGGGSPNAPTADVLYFVNGAYRQVTGIAAGATTINKTNVVTREDIIARLRVDLTNGATPPNGGAVVELYGDRGGS